MKLFRRKATDQAPAAPLSAAAPAHVEPVDIVAAAREGRELGKIDGAKTIDQLKNELTAAKIKGQIDLQNAENRLELDEVHHKHAKERQKDEEDTKEGKKARRREQIGNWFRRRWNAVCTLIRESADAIGVAFPVLASGVAAWYGQFLSFWLILEWPVWIAAGAAVAIESAYFGAFSRARRAREADPLESALVERTVGWFVVAVAAALNASHAIITPKITAEKVAEMTRILGPDGAQMLQQLNQATTHAAASLAVGFLSLLGPSLWEVHERRKWRNRMIALEADREPGDTTPSALLPMLPWAFRRAFRQEAKIILTEAVRRQVQHRYGDLLAFAEARVQASATTARRWDDTRNLTSLGLRVQMMLLRQRLRRTRGQSGQSVVRYTLDHATLSELSALNGQQQPQTSPSVTADGQPTVHATATPVSAGQQPQASTDPGQPTAQPGADSTDSSPVPADSVDTSPSETTMPIPVVTVLSAEPQHDADSGQSAVRRALSVPALDSLNGTFRQLSAAAVHGHGQSADLRADSSDSERGQGSVSGQSAVRRPADSSGRHRRTALVDERGQLSVDSALSSTADSGQSAMSGADTTLSVPAPGASPADSALSEDVSGNPAAVRADSVASGSVDGQLSTDSRHADNHAQSQPESDSAPRRTVTRLDSSEDEIIEAGVQVILTLWEQTGEAPRQADVLHEVRNVQGLGFPNARRSAYWRVMQELARQRRKISA